MHRLRHTLPAHIHSLVQCQLNGRSENMEPFMSSVSVADTSPQDLLTSINISDQMSQTNTTNEWTCVYDDLTICLVSNLDTQCDEEPA